MTASKTTRLLNISLIVVIMMVLVPVDCIAAQMSASKILSTGHFTLKWIDKTQAGERIEKLTLQHPLPISERQLVFHMAALSYESHSRNSKARPVFTREDIKKAKRLLTKALNKAHSQNIIGFEVESRMGIIKGHLFASGGNLHWRFFEIQGEEFSVTRNESTRYGTAWQMVLKKKQKFHETDELMGTLKLLNWIEAKIDLPAPKNLKTTWFKKDGPSPGTAPSAPSPSQPSSVKLTASKKNTADLEEILKALKNLHDNKFIGKQEYELKREILIKYF